MASPFSRFNPTPAFPSYPGPYQVGTVDFEVAASDIHGPDSVHEDPLVPTIAFRCFYPCDTPSKPSRPVYWIQSPQRSTLSAYVRFGGVNPTFSNILALFPRLLYYITLPVHRDAQILSSPHNNKRWPVVVFSHGLGGSRNSYSYICGALASHGLVVVAPEHRDGSCPITYVRDTRDSKAYSIEYARYSHKPSKEVYDGRDQQLRIRLWEMDCIYEALLQIDTDNDIKNLAQNKSSLNRQPELVAMFRDSLDLHTPGRVTWAGHSFGATTVTQFTKSVFYARQGTHTAIYPHAPPKSVESQVTPRSPIMLLDPWALPFNSPTTKSLMACPLPCFDSSNLSGGSTVLAVLSEAFANWSGNLNDIKALLSDPSLDSSQSTLSSDSVHPRRPGANIFFPEKSAHLSQSDFGILFPRLTKYFAKAEEPERLLKLNVRAMLQILRNVDIPVAEPTSCNIKTDNHHNSASNNTLTNTNSMSKGDWEILSNQTGLIRGWVALHANTASLKAAFNVGAVSDVNSLKSEESTSTGNNSVLEPAIGTDQLRAR